MRDASGSPEHDLPSFYSRWVIDELKRRIREVSKLKGMPLRSWLRICSILAAVVALVWAGLSRGLFDGVTLAIAIAALGLALLQRLPARPQLGVVPRTGGQLTFRHEKELRPFDEDQIVREQVDVCEKEMPRMPKPEFPPDSPLAVYLASAEAGARLQDAISGVSDSHLRAYMEKVSDHSIKLRKWLEAVDVGRADRVRVVEGRLRVQELGRAPADHVRLRMRFPEGFDIDEELPKVPQPPRRPHFEGFICRVAATRVLVYRGLLRPQRPDPIPRYRFT